MSRGMCIVRSASIAMRLLLSVLLMFLRFVRFMRLMSGLVRLLRVLGSLWLDWRVDRGSDRLLGLRLVRLVRGHVHVRGLAAATETFEESAEQVRE